jgi:SulP family sulfate permease
MTAPPRTLADLAHYDRADIGRDLIAATSVTLLAIPQGIAYAMIAGLPPAMGLYAAMLPAIVGSLFRSSRFVITGPTNAISLLVGSAVALALERGWDPVSVAGTLAVMVGAFQLGAALLRMGWLVDLIRTPVVQGYVTGAGVLIGVGQLHNLTGTPGASGTIPQQLSAWVGGVHAADARTLGIGLGSAALVWTLRRINRKLPAALIAMGLALGASLVLDLRASGVRVIADLVPIPGGIFPWTPPDLGQVPALIGMAVACAVISTVESTSVARAIAARQGESLRMSGEFIGQGLANITAGLFGAYPTSGSLTRSALNVRIGARTRLAGMLSGAMVIGVVMVAGPIVDLTPVASLAGILIVIATDLIEPKRIRAVWASNGGDRLAFAATVIGTWTMRLDYAIYLGVTISLIGATRRRRPGLPEGR